MLADEISKMKAEMMKPAVGNPFRKTSQSQTQQPPQPSYSAATPKPSQTNATSKENPTQTPSRPKQPVPAQKFEIDPDAVEAQKKQNLKTVGILKKKLAEKNEILAKERKVLTEVKREMSKMDATIARDVEVLRKQLESLSVQLSACKTRYHQKEKEFEDAKQKYDSVKEKKNKMTEHLIRILNENEKRKAEKLNRLMVKMDLAEEENVQQEKKQVLISEEKPVKEKPVEEKPVKVHKPVKVVEKETNQAPRNRFSGFHDDY